MSRRRGSSLGQVSRQLSSTTSEPLSDASDFSFKRYLVTRSGRGRGRGKIIHEACSYHSQYHTVRFRLLPKQLLLHNVSHSWVTAVGLCEDIAGSEAVGLGAAVPDTPLEPKTADKIASTQTEYSQRKDPGDATIPESTTLAKPSAPARGGSSGKEGLPSYSDVPDHFGCRIIEESPPTSPDV